MSYNQYGGNPYGAPPYGYPPSGFGGPMPNAQPGRMPFQPPANMPNINFNAPVIRLGGTQDDNNRRSDRPQPSGGRDRDRDAPVSLMPPTSDEKLRTILIHQIPEGVRGDEGIQKLLGAVGGLRKWEASASVMDDHKGLKFGFASFSDVESLANAIKLLLEQDVEVPVKRQEVGASGNDTDGIEKTKLNIAVDQSTIEFVETYEDGRQNDPDSLRRLQAARDAFKRALHELFYPPASNGYDADGDAAMKNGSTENVEVVNISLAQDDELADIPAEMREMVSGEIAAFRERSNQRDLERLREEEEMEELRRQRSGAQTSASAPRSAPVPNAPSGPRGQNGRGVSFVNGELSLNAAEEESDASDEEIHQRHERAQRDDDEKAYMDAERKWANRERSRQSALDREQDREKQETEVDQRRKDEQREREKAWDDDREASRKSHPYYRDHGAWLRKRGMDRVDEEGRDDADRRGEEDEARREKAQLEKARGMADSFLDQQAEELDRRDAAAAAPQPFKLSLGAAAQKAQASRGMPQRRTIAEVEGLLDNEDTEQGPKRQLVPMQLEPLSASATMTEEEISRAVRALAQEIPSDKDGLWNWDVKWEHMDDAVIRDKLRPFVEKKVVDYLGVQEEMLVEAVEEHLKKHGTAAALVEELEGALDEDAEDLVKKLWRMVIFFTESEKRGLPA